MTARSSSRSRKRIATMCRMLTFTCSTPVISHWTRLPMRSPHWSATLSVLHVEGSWRGTLAEDAMRTLFDLHEADRGGHFAAWEQPQRFAAKLRAAFRSLR